MKVKANDNKYIYTIVGRNIKRIRKGTCSSAISRFNKI